MKNILINASLLIYSVYTQSKPNPSIFRLRLANVIPKPFSKKVVTSSYAVQNPEIPIVKPHVIDSKASDHKPDVNYGAIKQGASLDFIKKHASASFHEKASFHKRLIEQEGGKIDATNSNAHTSNSNDLFPLMMKDSSSVFYKNIPSYKSSMDGMIYENDFNKIERRGVKFDLNKNTVHETYRGAKKRIDLTDKNAYDRRRIKRHKITLKDKAELIQYKMHEMKVHPDSKKNTHVPKLNTGRETKRSQAQ